MIWSTLESLGLATTGTAYGNSTERTHALTTRGWAAGGAVALYALGGSSKAARLLALGLAGWATWDYLTTPQRPQLKLIPYDPDAPMPLEQGATSSAPPAADPFKGTRWEGSSYTPSVRPARPGETTTGGKVIPLRPPTPEERAMFYGINPEPGDNVG